MKTMLFVYIAILIFGALRTIIRFVARRKRSKKGEDATMLQPESRANIDAPSSDLVSTLIDILGKMCNMKICTKADGKFEVITEVTSSELCAMLASKIIL